MMLADAWNDADQHSIGRYEILDAAAATNITFSNHGREVMRITKDGITVNPDLSVDEAACSVLAALDHYIRQMVADKDTEIMRLKAQLAAYEGDETNG
jgi:hypothetical protein